LRPARLSPPSIQTPDIIHLKIPQNLHEGKLITEMLLKIEERGFRGENSRILQSALKLDKTRDKKEKG